MATLHHNISGLVTQRLLAPGDLVSPSKISLTNTGSFSCNIDLYIEKRLTGKFYLLKEYNLPIGGTYIHNGVSFDNKNKQFGLYIKLSGNDPSVDVIIL